MKASRPAGLVYVAMLLCYLIAGCTGTNMTVNPAPDTSQMTVVKGCGAVAIKETPAEHVYPPAGNLVPGFAAALEKSGLAAKVYYPARPDDKVDLTLDARFDVLFDANMGSNLTKSFFTGLTLFILEPVFWFNYNYDLKGNVTVVRGSARVQTLEAASDAEMSMKFLSLGEAQQLEGNTLNKAKDSLFRQLLIQLNKECGK